MLVLIPAHGRPTLLIEAIESVQAQTLTDWTCYVASTQSPWTPHEPRLALIEGKEGQPANRNALLDKWESTDDEYACWLDDDDAMSPERLAKQKAYLDAHPEIDVLYTYLCYSDFSLDAKLTMHTRKPVRTCDPTLYTDDPFSPGWNDNQNHATVMMRRSALAYRYPEQPMIGEDKVWLYSMYHGGLRFAVLPEVLYYYRIHDGNVSNPAKLKDRDDYHELYRRMEAALDAARAQAPLDRGRAALHPLERA